MDRFVTTSEFGEDVIARMDMVSYRKIDGSSSSRGASNVITFSSRGVLELPSQRASDHRVADSTQLLLSSSVGLSPA